MHFNSVMLDSDLEIVEGQKKVVYEPKVKIASMTCKSIAIWRTRVLWKCNRKKNSDELLKWNEEKGTPVVMHDLIMWINQVVKYSSFASVRNSFEIMAANFVPYFEGEKDYKDKKDWNLKEISPIKLNAMHFKARVIY